MQGLSFETTAKAIPIRVLSLSSYEEWLALQPQRIVNWLQSSGFTAKPESWAQLSDHEGQVKEIIFIHDAPETPFFCAALALALPAQRYRFTSENLNAKALSQAVKSWGLAHYQFTRYRSEPSLPKACLEISENERLAYQWVEALCMVRDLINTPTEDLGPLQLSEFCQRFQGQMQEVVGEDLLKENYPLIHAVGRGSDRAPRLIDLHFGSKSDPLLVLVGKGVCFDSGGLDLKSAEGMALMKKDMGGAAHVLGLAQLILIQQWPIQLRVLIPAVENVVSGSAYKPGDVYRARNGISVEIGNTDAEGRLILADALVEAARLKPKLILDFATLTGAARVALGPDIPVFFCADRVLQDKIMQLSQFTEEWVWPLPLYSGYQDYIKSSVADLNNNSKIPYAGAITAALFLQNFVPAGQPWVHIDLMAFNLAARPGRPQGGEAMGLTVFCEFIRSFFGI